MFRGSSSSGGSKSEKADTSSVSDPASSTSPKERAADSAGKSPSPDKEQDLAGADRSSPSPVKAADQAASGEKRSGNGSPPSASSSADQKKRRSSGTPLQKLGKQDQALAVPQGQHNNAAGESLPGPRSTFRVGVWEDRNKKCRRTMEDTHAFLYNFLHTPAPALGAEGSGQAQAQPATVVSANEAESQGGAAADEEMTETDNGYFAIFDGHAGTFAADWCGKKLHIILEEIIRKNPNSPIPELLDQTFTAVDAQLEKLPLKNSGCTAAIAVLRWEDRVPSSLSATGSQAIAPALAKAAAEEASRPEEASASLAAPDAAHAKLKSTAARQRVLYTANVGDARIILCRQGKALRLSYDHKGSDENEGKRITNAGGLILNNRVNGVLAVTRALGDTYMKDLVTGHPYTTETVIQPDLDEFIIIACDGLWDVCSDQDAVDLVRNVQDPVAAAKLLVDHALAKFSTDNLSCMIVRLDKQALLENQNNKDRAIGVEGDAGTGTASGHTGISETEKILKSTQASIADGRSSPMGVSASNSGKGHDLSGPPASVPTSAPVAGEGEGQAGFVPTLIEGSVEEEPAAIGGMDDLRVSPEATVPPASALEAEPDKIELDPPADANTAAGADKSA
ncbi:phosphatase 2C-like domain-containing protein [Dichotomopilus funicola]|uniref:Phosphatase 2C-like domain-containing protein n=1 Tax=Dichotomopilus funicola TaxID=1934379 RepID=A0AAN6ZJA0_9PEZI|nr:phosphatase 2C-like domain-containing protein [Dichotomopilus funicola]